MDRNQEAVKISLLINIVLIILQFLAVLWLIGPFTAQFKSIFESMNVQLPTLTTLLISFSGAVDGFLGWILVFLICVVGAGSGYFVLRNQQIYIVLPILNAMQSLALLIGFFVLICIFVPLMTLVSGVS